MVRVTLTTSVQLTARFDMDVSEFNSIGGQTLFINRMCALLDIQDTSRFKIVGIYTGSVIIDSVIDV